jgi:hypothetical protein
VEIYRKCSLRKKLLAFSEEGPIYVPFIGDGDIADLLYKDREIYGADIDKARIETARERLPRATLEVADCNFWPFPKVKENFAIADFNAYSDPYPSFRMFWLLAPKAERLVLYFTDGHRQGIIRGGHFIKPDGKKEFIEETKQRQRIFHQYLPRFVLPWFRKHIEPYEVRQVAKYLRGMQLYWGAVIEKK